LEFVRVVEGLRPKAILIENVPGLSRRANGNFRKAIEDKLKKLGYNVSSFELNAADYGVPQNRVRLFFVGIVGKHFNPPDPVNKKLTVRDAISDLPPLNPGEEKNYYVSDPLTDYQRLMRGECRTLHNHRAPNHPKWTVELIKKTRPGEPLYNSFKQRIRLSWDKPAPTIPAGGIRPQWFFAHPEQPRGITVREMARLQSFPDSYIFYGSTIKQRVLVGDAVPPLLAKALAEKLKEYL
jgi:DNA (cytosine-5)-methyltransferase 1